MTLDNTDILNSILPIHGLGVSLHLFVFSEGLQHIVYRSFLSLVTLTSKTPPLAPMVAIPNGLVAAAVLAWNKVQNEPQEPTHVPVSPVHPTDLEECCHWPANIRDTVK